MPSTLSSLVQFPRSQRRNVTWLSGWILKRCSNTKVRDPVCRTASSVVLTWPLGIIYYSMCVRVTLPIYNSYSHMRRCTSQNSKLKVPNVFYTPVCRCMFVWSLCLCDSCDVLHSYLGLFATCNLTFSLVLFLLYISLGTFCCYHWCSCCRFLLRLLLYCIVNFKVKQANCFSYFCSQLDSTIKIKIINKNPLTKVLHIKFCRHTGMASGSIWLLTGRKDKIGPLFQSHLGMTITLYVTYIGKYVVSQVKCIQK